MDVTFESTVVLFHDGAMACRMIAALQQAAKQQPSSSEVQ